MVYTGNVTTHCPVTTDLGTTVKANNVSILKDEVVVGEGCDYDLSLATQGDVMVVVAAGAVV
ncbi:hypothetical protein ENSA7_19820 [Enhygromyxa salina]|uniref:Uncharacterized protein n=2 Tax=Enhygromyxa salina TaxID=215803 RepID=A0A2S9YTB1_9BACT|nr:hypothetical protein ENSA7_19820 [Enhygromyxa salina]